MPDETEGALAQRLNKLFEEVPHSSGRTFGNTEVAEAIKAKHPKIQVSGAYLGQIRRGQKRKPDFDLLLAIAEFFDVPGTYWAERNSKKTDAQILAARLAKNHGVRTLAARAAGLRPDNLAAALAVVEALLTAQEQTTGRQDGPPAPTM